MQGFIVTLMICSVTMSMIALVYMAASPFLAKRYSAKWRYYTWLVVVIGLIIPFRPQWGSAVIRVFIPGENAPVIQVGSRIVAGQIESQVSGQTESEADVSTTLTVGKTAVPSFWRLVPWWRIAAAVWLAGLMVTLVYHIIKYYCFAKMVRRWSEKATNEKTLDLLQRLKSEMGILKPIGLYQCPCIGSPMMIGLTNPRILLPKTGIKQNELHFILKHELVHLKRNDLYYKCLVLAATAIHWFNPFVYIIAKAIEVQCELSCDAETVRSADAGTRRHYTEAIISFVKYSSNLNTALSTNFQRGRKGMMKRIFSIMDTGNKKAGIAIFCAALLVTLGTGFAVCYGAPYSETTVGSVMKLGGIDWRVLLVKDGKALVLSDKILSKRAYNASVNDWPNGTVTWEECDLRRYLNGQFFDTAFSNEEKGRIVETVLDNNNNPWFATAGGSATKDRVFLLSIEEVVQYLGNNEKLEARNDGTFLISDRFNERRIAQTLDGEEWRWLLRSPGILYYSCGAAHVHAACVAANGDLSVSGEYVNNSGGGVRPAMWLTM